MPSNLASKLPKWHKHAAITAVVLLVAGILIGMAMPATATSQAHVNPKLSITEGTIDPQGNDGEDVTVDYADPGMLSVFSSPGNAYTTLTPDASITSPDNTLVDVPADVSGDVDTRGLVGDVQVSTVYTLTIAPLAASPGGAPLAPAPAPMVQTASTTVPASAAHVDSTMLATTFKQVPATQVRNGVLTATTTVTGTTAKGEAVSSTVTHTVQKSFSNGVLTARAAPAKVQQSLKNFFGQFTTKSVVRAPAPKASAPKPVFATPTVRNSG